MKDRVNVLISYSEVGIDEYMTTRRIGPTFRDVERADYLFCKVKSETTVYFKCLKSRTPLFVPTCLYDLGYIKYALEDNFDKYTLVIDKL